MSMVKNHPQNKAGYVKLLSADPQDVPEINFMHFEQGRETDMGKSSFSLLSSWRTQRRTLPLFAI